MNRPPAFQFYPDKWQSHTRRLSDSAYRVYHELICWMWQSSEDHSSIKASAEAVACAIALPIECVRAALDDIQNPFCPLLKEEDGRWVSNGLRKEADKQAEWREKSSMAGKASAAKRKNSTTVQPPLVNLPTTVAKNTNGGCNLVEPKSNSLSLSLSPKHERERGFAERPSLAEVQSRAAVIGLAPWKAEDWLNEMEGCGWLDFNHRPVANWQAVLTRVKAKWEADGRPCSPPAAKNAQKPAIARLGPSLKEVQTYAETKDDGTKRAQAYATSWFRFWEERNWKRRDGHGFDWQIRFAEDLVNHLNREKG